MTLYMYLSCISKCNLQVKRLKTNSNVAFVFKLSQDKNIFIEGKKTST